VHQFLAALATSETAQWLAGTSTNSESTGFYHGNYHSQANCHTFVHGESEKA